MKTCTDRGHQYFEVFGQMKLLLTIFFRKLIARAKRDIYSYESDIERRAEQNL